MCVEGVVDAAIGAAVHRKAYLGGALLDHRAGAFGLLGRAAIFAQDMLGDALAFLCHHRIELERVEAEIDVDQIARPPQRLLEPAQADDAPGA